VRRLATRSSDAARPSLPSVSWRARARNGLRWLERRWRQISPRPLSPWREPARPEISRVADELTITVESVGRLRAALTDPALAGAARAVEVRVTDWRPPWAGWSGRLGPLPGLVDLGVRLPSGDPGRGWQLAPGQSVGAAPAGLRWRRAPGQSVGAAPSGPATVRVGLAEPVDVPTVVAAVLAVLEPVHPLPSALRAELAVAGDPLPWLPPGPVPVPDPRHPYDVPVVGSAYGMMDRILVDATAANPHGRKRFGPELPSGVLSLVDEGSGIGWRIATADRHPIVVVAGRVGEPLDARQAAALARLGAVTLARPSAGVPSAAWAGEAGRAGETDRDGVPSAAWDGEAGPAGDVASAGVPPGALAAAVAQLAMTGLVVHAPGVELPLVGELVELLRADLPGPEADPLAWELRSVAQRRAALRGHAAGLVGPASSGLPTVSALLVTRRPHRIAETIAALSAQRYPRLEIVVGLHGVELAPAERAELAAAGVPIEVLDLPAELSFGGCLAAVTRAARGSLVTKVDDDDWYGPEHVWDLVLARHFSGATVVGKAAEFTYLAPYDTTVRRRMGSEMYTDVVAGGALLLARGDLEAVGGWRPLPKSVDRALLDRVLQAGGLIYRTHAFGFVYVRHTDGHTWDPGLPYFLRNPVRTWSGRPAFEELA